VGRLEARARLEEPERIPGWVRARCRGWILYESVDVEGAVAVLPAAPSSASSVGTGSAILAGPNGDALARMCPGTQLQVLVARETGCRCVWRDGPGYRTSNSLPIQWS
jgi:hypothetical protein